MPSAPSLSTSSVLGSTTSNLSSITQQGLPSAGESLPRSEEGRSDLSNKFEGMHILETDGQKSFKSSDLDTDVRRKVLLHCNHMVGLIAIDHLEK